MRCENNRGSCVSEDSEAAFVKSFKVASEAMTEQNNNKKNNEGNSHMYL